MHKYRFLTIIMGFLAGIAVSCSSPEEKLKGEWEVVSVGEGSLGADESINYDVANELMRGLKYGFRNDTVYINDSMVAEYTVDSSAIVLTSAEYQEIYTFDVSSDSLFIENNVIKLSMVRKTK